MLTQHLKAALGIDNERKNKSDYRSWAGLKKLFQNKLVELVKLTVRHPGMTVREHLPVSAAGNIKVALERQLKYVDFYKQDGDEEIDLPASVIDKLKDAPLTNSGCESQFADLDNSVKKFGGHCLINI